MCAAPFTALLSNTRFHTRPLSSAPRYIIHTCRAKGGEGKGKILNGYLIWFFLHLTFDSRGQVSSCGPSMWSGECWGQRSELSMPAGLQMIDVGTQRGWAPSSPSWAQTSLRAPAATAALSREMAFALRSLTATLQNTQTLPRPECPSILPVTPLTLINSDSRNPSPKGRRRKNKKSCRSVSALPSYLTRALTFSIYLLALLPLHPPTVLPPSSALPMSSGDIEEIIVVFLLGRRGLFFFAATQLKLNYQLAHNQRGWLGWLSCADFM